MKGHKCGSRYKLPRDDPAYADLRTTLPEVYNRVLKNIRTSVRYMSHTSAFAYVDYFIMIRNEMNRKKIEQAEYI